MYSYLNWVKNCIFRHRTKKKETATTINIDHVPRYPPPPKQWPFIHPGKLLRHNRRLLFAITSELDITRYDYKTLVEPALYRYAAMVQLLPSTRNYRRDEPLGMFTNGLEVGLWMLRLLNDVSVREQHELIGEAYGEHPWRIIALFCGLVHEVEKLRSDLIITSVDESEEWDPLVGPLWDWGSQRGFSAHLLRWVDEPCLERSVSIDHLVATKIIGDDVLDCFYKLDQKYVSDELRAIYQVQPNEISHFMPLLKEAIRRNVNEGCDAMLDTARPVRCAF